MQNRAKCKLCDKIIESMHETDYMTCECGEISVYGGHLMQCGARDWAHFVRVDDIGNEIAVAVEDSVKEEGAVSLDPGIERKSTLIANIDEMIRYTKELPTHVMQTPITHYDYVTLLTLIREVLKT